MLTLLLAAALAQGAEWKRVTVKDVPFSFEVPEDAQTRDVTARSDEGGYAPGLELTGEVYEGQGWPIAIRVQYSQDWDWQKTGYERGMSMMPEENLWGKPERKKWRGYDTAEMAWKDVVRKGEINISYFIELGPKRYVEVSLRCTQDTFKKYAPVYTRLKESLQPVKKR